MIVRVKVNKALIASLRMNLEYYIMWRKLVDWLSDTELERSGMTDMVSVLKEIEYVNIKEMVRPCWTNEWLFFDETDI